MYCRAADKNSFDDYRGTTRLRGRRHAEFKSSFNTYLLLAYDNSIDTRFAKADSDAALLWTMASSPSALSAAAFRRFDRQQPASPSLPTRAWAGRSIHPWRGPGDCGRNLSCIGTSIHIRGATQRRDHARTYCCIIMEPHARATSSVYSVAFDLDTLLEQITTAQAKEHQSSDANGEPPKSYGVTRAWEHHAAIENNTLSESCEVNQTLEQQLVAQNAELRERLDSARKHFARLYNAMSKTMEVSRELYDIHLKIAHEKVIKQKKGRASGEYF